MAHRQETVPLISSNEEDSAPETTNCCGKRIKKSTQSELVIILLMVAVILCGSGNRVAYKIMTVPMQNYSFFLSLFNSILYVPNFRLNEFLIKFES